MIHVFLFDCHNKVLMEFNVIYLSVQSFLPLGYMIHVFLFDCHDKVLMEFNIIYLYVQSFLPLEYMIHAFLFDCHHKVLMEFNVIISMYSHSYHWNIGSMSFLFALSG